MKIRKAIKKDFSEYLMLKKEEEMDFSSIIGKEIGRFSSKVYKKEFLDIFKSKKSILLVAEGGSSLIGFLYGTFYKNMYESGGYVEVIYVAKNNRKKGVATELMGKFTKILTKKGLKKIKLSVNVKNKGAYEFYKRLGFKLHHLDLMKEIK